MEKQENNTSIHCSCIKHPIHEKKIIMKDGKAERKGKPLTFLQNRYVG